MMILFGLGLLVFSLIFCAIATLMLSEDELKGGWFCGFGCIVLAILAFGTIGAGAKNEGRGEFADATQKLELGETFSLAEDAVKIEDFYLAFVKKNNGEILGLRFFEMPPKNGVVAKSIDGKKVIFIAISNPEPKAEPVSK